MEAKQITSGNRPASIWYNHTEVRIDLHDAWYVRTCRHLLAIMKQVHPDRRYNKNGKKITGASFLKASSALLVFRADQAAWYKRRGLTSPHVTLHNLPVNPNVRILTGWRSEKLDFLRAFNLPIRRDEKAKKAAV